MIATVGIVVLGIAAFSQEKGEGKPPRERVTALSNLEAGILVLGQCKTPCLVEPSKDERYTVAEVLVRAGGFADTADAKRVLLMRGATATNLNLSLVNSRDAMRNLRPGDILVVMKRESDGGR